MRLAVLPGDGIGPEITAAMLDVLARADTRYGLGVHPERHVIGLAALAAQGTTAPPAVLEACRLADGIVLGPISHADYPPPAEGGVNVSAAS